MARSLKTDAASLARATALLRYHFDLEILLKRNELQTIKARLAEADELARALAAAAGSYNGTQSTSATLTASDAPAQGGERAVYSMLADGTFLRWTCPRCNRTDFASATGFRTHCRQVHRIAFNSLQETLRICGVVVPESDVPPQHPCRTEPTIFLTPLDSSAANGHGAMLGVADDETEAMRQEVASALQASREKPTIKVYDEQVAVDSDQGEQDSDSGSAPPSPYAPPTCTREGALLRTDPAQLRICGAAQLRICGPAQLRKCGHSPMAMFATRRPSISAAAAAVRSGRASDSDTEGPPRRVTPAPSTAPSSVQPSAAAGTDGPAPAAGGSRFYVQKKVVVGNSSRYIPTDRRGDNEDVTHRWRVYVRAPPDDPDLAFIQKVRFFLHPSFAPNDLVEVSKPPFELRRSGWGEFPLRVQLYLVDPRRNKPVDVIHMLKLDHTLAGVEVLGAESVYNIEVDRASLATATPTPLATAGSQSSSTATGIPVTAAAADGTNSDVAAALASVVPATSESAPILAEPPAAPAAALQTEAPQVEMSPKSLAVPSSASALSSAPPTAVSSAPPPAVSSGPPTALSSDTPTAPPPTLPSASSSNATFTLPSAPPSAPLFASPSSTATSTPASAPPFNGPDALPSWATLPWPDRLLAEAVHRFPIVGAGSEKLPYACAPSVQAFLLWDTNRRNQLEVKRAKALRKHMLRRLRQMPAVPPTEPASAFAGTEPTAISSRQLVAWCQAQGYTPQRMQPRSGAGAAGPPTPALPTDRAPTPAGSSGALLAVCHRCGSSAHATGLCDIMTPLTLAVAATGLPGISRAALLTPDADDDGALLPASTADPVVQAVVALADAVASRPPAKRRRLYDHELDSRSPASAVWAAPTRRRPVSEGANDGGADDDNDDVDIDVDDSDDTGAAATAPSAPSAPSASPAPSAPFASSVLSVPSVPSAPSAPSGAAAASAASTAVLSGPARWSLAQRAAAVSLRPLGAASSMPFPPPPVWPTGKGAAVASLSADALEALWQSGMRFAAALVRQSVLQVPIAAAVTASADEPAVAAAALVPAHVWRAVASLPEADFLTQQYMAPKQ